jgi:hypothetical protein
MIDDNHGMVMIDHAKAGCVRNVIYQMLIDIDQLNKSHTVWYQMIPLMSYDSDLANIRYTIMMTMMHH